VRRGYIHGGLNEFEIVWTSSKHLADGRSPTSCGKWWNGRGGLANVTQTPLERESEARRRSELSGCRAGIRHSGSMESWCDGRERGCCNTRR
jgi:hypothetical protein